MGSFRTLADGSRIIGWGYTGVPNNLTFTELSPTNGEDILDFSFTEGNWSYRGIKIPISAFDIDVLRATAGGS
jgi:hypothetical protein